MSKLTDSIDKKLDALLEKQKQLKAQKQAAQARERSKQQAQARKDDTRRKILIGSFILKQIETNEEAKNRLLSNLNEYLTENRDRKLFDLPLIDDSNVK
jgi:hypothetical protein